MMTGIENGFGTYSIRNRLAPIQTGDSLQTVLSAGKLNGDYTSGFEKAFRAESDKSALPSGAAVNNAVAPSAMRTIDKTSALYEKSLELESYIIKIMLSSMRGTLTGASVYGEKPSYAQKMYEDMLYDEMAVTVTKNAGFGLADQVYLQLSQD